MPVDVETIGFLVVIVVAFLRDVIVVLRFTVTFVDATGFLVVFITVAVAFFDGLIVVAGRRVLGRDSAATDVRLNACDGTGFLVVVDAGFFVLENVLDGECLVVILIVGVVAGGEVERFAGRFESWIDWNVVSLIPSVVVGSSSFRLIDVETFFSMIVPSVVEKPPACTVYLSVAVGLFDVGISSKVLLL